jgi:uncharacterized protein HemX
MQVLLPLTLGVVIGFVIGWLVAASKWQTALSNCKIQAEANVKGAESTIVEVRRNLAETKSESDTKAKEISDLQQLLKGEAEQKAAAQAEFKEARCKAPR